MRFATAVLKWLMMDVSQARRVVVGSSVEDDAVMGLGMMMFAAGLVGYIFGKLGEWWHHG